MNHQNCEAQRESVPSTDDDVIMRSPSSAGFPPEARAEARSSRQGIAAIADKRESVAQERYLSSIAPFQSTKIFRVEDGTASAHTTVPRLRRRASQGSLRSRPSAVSRFLAKGNLPLQLPSFESLGITTPAQFSANAPARLSASFHGSPSNPGLIVSAPSTSHATVKGQTRSDYPSGLPLTPPADDDENVSWNPRSGISIFDAHMNREPKPMAHMDEGRNRNSGSSPDGMDGLSGSSDHKLTHHTGGEEDLGSPSGEMPGNQDAGSWLENGIGAALSSLLVSNNLGEAVKIVSQTLPYPRAADKSVTLPTQDSVFCSIVQTIQDRLQPGQSPYINITHAVPEQFSLSNLPTSPPSTPGLLVPGNDYFHSTVFSSATPVPAYYDFRGPLQSSHSPFPIAPPHSVHIAVVERYLPPSSVQEYKDLFCPDRPSVLVDRLKELSPNGGSLLLIYPTKKGAQSFKTQYLGPILDPLLRQMVVVNELSADVGRFLGRLASVAQMDDFETMKSNITQLCQTISSPASRYTLVDAGRGAAHLDRGLWAEWYIQQERARMKEILNIYWRNGQRLPINKSVSTSNRIVADKEVTSAMLLAEIFEGIKKRPYSDGEPHDGVELGVFVIRRSR